MATIQKVMQNKRYILMTALLLSATFVFSSMSFAGTVVDGCGDNKPITITHSSDWQSLCSRTLTLATKSHCVVSGSVGLKNTVTGVHNEYRFTADNDNNPVTGKKAERMLDVSQSSGIDPIDLSAAPLNDIRNLAAGTYTFRLLGRKEPGAENIDVTAYTLGVVCNDIP